MTLPTIALLGLGAMGSRMAPHWLAAGFPLVVTNRTRSRADALVEQGARWADTPALAAASADVVVACVTDDEASRTLWLHPESGALAGMRSGALAIESSTLTTAWVTELAGALQREGMRFLDAPVAGSRPQAEAAALIHLVGGADDDVREARTVLDPVGGAFHHLGPIGAGAAMKLAVNAYFGVQVAAMAELVGLLVAEGLDRNASLQALGAMPITSPALAGMSKAMAARHYAPLFPIDLVAKDLRYAVSTAAAHEAPLPLTDAARQSFVRAQELGFGGDNIHGVIQVYAE